MSRSAHRVPRPAPAHAAPESASPSAPARVPAWSPRRTGLRAGLPGVLLSLLLVLFGGAAAVQHPGGHDTRSAAQSASDGTQYQAPPQHLQQAIAHPAHAATHAPLPLLPAVGQDGSQDQPAHVLPERPRLTAAHLTHHSPRQGRAPPARAGI